MDILIWILAATFFVSLLGLSGVVVLPLRDEQLKKAIFALTSFAVGGLLGGAFFHLLPEALGMIPPNTVMLYTLAGFIAFLLVEVFFHWHLGSGHDIHPYSYLLLIGDAVHNFIDGLIIAGSFLVSIPFGLVTTVLIVAHEIPEELGIFGVLVHGGISKKKAITYGFLVQCTALCGGLAGYFLSGSVEGFTGLLLPFAGGGFIYIAGSGLIPELHNEQGARKLISLGLIFVGLIFRWVIKAVGGA